MVDTESYPMNEVADLMLISKASVTSLIDTLEQKGLLERVSNPNDRRPKIIKTTPKGFDLTEELSPHCSMSMNQLFESFTKDEIKSLNEKIVNMLKKL